MAEKLFHVFFLSHWIDISYTYIPHQLKQLHELQILHTVYRVSCNRDCMTVRERLKKKKEGFKKKKVTNFQDMAISMTSCLL